MRPGSLQLSIVVAAALLACADHAPVVDAHPLVSTPPVLASADGGLPATVALLEAPDAGVDAGDELATSPDKPSIDPLPWLDARGVSHTEQTKFANAWGCEEIAVGAAHEPALVCSTVEEISRKTAKFPIDRILEHRSVSVVRAKKLVNVLDVIEVLAPLDKEPPTAPNIVDLALHVAPDGLSAKLDEHTEFAGTRCAEARAQNHQQLHGTDSASMMIRDFATFDRDLIARVCGSLGEFEWKKDRFVRRIFTDALPMGAPKPAAKEDADGWKNGF